MSSILFDDLNDQEFQEALNQMYENDSEFKVTNLFEQSFEDRIKSAEKTINEDTEYFLNEEEMKRSELPDKAFGVPEQRKYPLINEKHVRSAIKLFNYVDPKYEEELANNIKKKMKQYKITDINVGEKNRFSKYYNSDKKAVNESESGKGFDVKSGWLHKDKNGKWGIEFPTEEEYDEYMKDQEEDDNEIDESYNDFYYTRRDILMEELGEFITEAKVLYLEKDSKIITKPNKCPKCGSKLGIFIEGEPICKCTNKDCSHYVGTVAFNQSEAKKKYETIKEEADTSTEHFEVKLHDSSNKDKIMFNGVEKDIDDKSYQDKFPIPLEFFPNDMGINLCSVDSMSWDRQKDGQLTNIVIKFIPAPSDESREYKSYQESVDIINEHFPDMGIICTILVEAEEQKDEVKDKVKGKPSPISSEAVKIALEAAMEIPDKKKRSEKLRSIMASTIGKLSAKIKYIFGNLKLYDNEYNYDGYIRDLFPKYLDELTAKDLYKLKESIMEHAFTTGRGHKSLKDVINSNQMSSDKDNYMYNLADKVRKDLSVLLHTIDSKYEKARFDGVKPYEKNAPKEEPKKEEKKQEEKKEEEPKKKRKSYWDVDVSEEDEDDEEEDIDESAELLEESFKLPKDAKTELDQYKDKINGTIISPKQAKTEGKTTNFDFKSKSLIPVVRVADNEYLTYNITKRQWCITNVSDNLVYKFSDSLKRTLNINESVDEILEETKAHGYTIMKRMDSDDSLNYKDLDKIEQYTREIDVYNNQLKRGDISKKDFDSKIDKVFKRAGNYKKYLSVDGSREVDKYLNGRKEIKDTRGEYIENNKDYDRNISEKELSGSNDHIEKIKRHYIKANSEDNPEDTLKEKEIIHKLANINDGGSKDIYIDSDGKGDKIIITTEKSPKEYKIKDSTNLIHKSKYNNIDSLNLSAKSKEGMLYNSTRAYGTSGKPTDSRSSESHEYIIRGKDIPEGSTLNQDGDSPYNKSQYISNNNPNTKIKVSQKK